MAKTQNFCHQLLTPKCEYLKCQRVREMRETDKEGEMENFIIIKGLKMRRDAFFDPRGYKYINPLPYPPPHCTPQLLAPLDGTAIAAASSSRLRTEKITVPNRCSISNTVLRSNLLFY